MEKMKFKLDVFEGPLDVLLHLISKHKLNIEDIEISVLLEQYLNYINEMKARNLDVASEFLEMAARLVYIKTCSLLPSSEDEEKKLKQELTGQLLELELVKQIAAKLSERSKLGIVFTHEAMEYSFGNEHYEYTHKHEPDELVKAYMAVQKKIKRHQPPPKSAFSGIVEHKIVSVTSRVVHVLRMLYRNERIPYEEFFAKGERSEMVATFLAMLELVKSKRITVSPDNRYVIFNNQK